MAPSLVVLYPLFFHQLKTPLTELSGSALDMPSKSPISGDTLKKCEDPVRDVAADEVICNKCHINYYRSQNESNNTRQLSPNIHEKTSVQQPAKSPKYQYGL